jgi:hypothetical protein
MMANCFMRSLIETDPRTPSLCDFLGDSVSLWLSTVPAC